MPQRFRTSSPGTLPPAFYQVSIRAPGAVFAEFATYTFPLSPSQLRSDRSALSTFADVQGDSTSQGVLRVVDSYGLAPPVFTIEGTTGVDRHLQDGYVLTGLQSLQLLVGFLSQYATLNQQQREQGSSESYSLEFYDYYLAQFWQVEPIGPQILRQSADRPTLVYYRLRWAGVRPLDAPLLGVADAILQVLGPPAAVAAVNAASTMGALVAAYSPSGPIG